MQRQLSFDINNDHVKEKVSYDVLTQCKQTQTKPAPIPDSLKDRQVQNIEQSDKTRVGSLEDWMSTQFDFQDLQFKTMLCESVKLDIWVGDKRYQNVPAPCSFDDFTRLCNIKYCQSRPFAFNHHLPSIIKYKINETEWDFVRNAEDLERAYNFAKDRHASTDFKLILQVEKREIQFMPQAGENQGPMIQKVFRGVKSQFQQAQSFLLGPKPAPLVVQQSA